MMNYLSHELNKSDYLIKLCWRLFFCCIAIGLLWITTIDLAISIVKYSIPSPTFNSVTSSCNQAYYYTKYERNNYELCGDIQSKQCYNDFQFSLIRENDRNDDVLNANSILQNNVQMHQQTCQKNLENTITALSAWVNEISSDQRTQKIIFHPTCSASDRSKVASLLGTTLQSETTTSPNDLKKKNMKYARDFTKSTSSTIKSVVDYSLQLLRYNQEYLDNHTRLTYPQYTSNFVNSLSTPYVQYLLGSEVGSLSLSTTLKANLASLVACVSLDPNGGRCTLSPYSVLSEYSTIQTIANGQIQQIKLQISKMEKMVQDYGQRVLNAISLADSYFDATTCIILFFSFIILLATLNWVQNNLVPLSANFINLCNVGSGSVSWCDITKVSHSLSPLGDSYF